MKVEWYPETGDSVVLADDSIAAGPGSKRVLDSWPQHSSIVQTASRIRAAEVSNYGRLNGSVVYNLQTRVEFSSCDECMRYRDGLGSSVMNGRGWIEISYDSSYSTIRGAVCTSITFSQRYGVSTVVDFQFVGEEIS